jgi:phosphatidate cytidylyltransferase
MSGRWADLLSRGLLTTLGFVTVVGLVVGAPLGGWRAVTVAAIAVAGWEWNRLTRPGSGTAAAFGTAIGAAAITALLSGAPAVRVWPGLALGASGAILLGLVQTLRWPALGLVVCGLGGAFIPLLARDYGAGWALVALAVCWGGDIGGYIVGRAWGRRALVPRISPRKTVEGTAGSLITGIGLAWVVKSAFGLAGDAIAFTMIAVIACVLGILGDLAESWLKRRAGKEHSGNVFGPEGGMLDVLDGLLVVSPALYVLAPLAR